MTLDSTIKIVGVLIVLIFYIPLLLMLAKQSRAKKGRKDFYNAVSSIISREENNDKAVEQINIVFKKLSEINSQVAKKYKNRLIYVKTFYVVQSLMVIKSLSRFIYLSLVMNKSIELSK